MVDDTHLHGKYEGNLMIATSQDANNQIYPLTFAIVDSENDDSWRWFFEQLKILFQIQQIWSSYQIVTRA